MNNQELVEEFVKKNKSPLLIVAYLCCIFVLQYVWPSVLFPWITLSNVVAMMTYRENVPQLVSMFVLVNCALSTMILIREQPSAILYFIQLYSSLVLMRDGNKV